MMQRLQIYKCEVCGNVVEVLHAGAGDLVCSGQPMKLMTENTVDASKEKHVPVVDKTGDGVKVRVGSIPHPMEEKHYIEWIQIISADGMRAFRKFLKPGEAAEAEFPLKEDGFTAREFCNLHLLWKS